MLKLELESIVNKTGWIKLEELEKMVWKSEKKKPKEAGWYLVWIRDDICPCSKFWSGFDWIVDRGEKVRYWRVMPKGPIKGEI